MEETMLTGESRDIVSDNISKLKEIFPDVITEDKIDFEKLKLILGEDVETSSERYSFTWPGKTQAIKESQKQSTGTLRPCKEESKNWDTTGNLYIEGDNLEVLKLLQKSYYGKIKAIYIDPPYNTGKEFVYSDDYKDNLDNYLKLTGQVSGHKERGRNKSSGEGRITGESIGIKLSTNTETQGRYHSNWLNMMYPRLKLARNLLTEDGVIFISIDNNEENNLIKICDEIFGEENFISIPIRRKNKLVMKGNKTFKNVLEPLIIYAKNKNHVNFEYSKKEKVLSDFSLISSGYGIKEVKFLPGQLKFRVNDGFIEKNEFERLILLDDLIIENGQNKNEVKIVAEFKWSQDKIHEKLDDNAFILIKKIDKMTPRIYFETNTAKPIDYINGAYGKVTNEDAISELKDLGLEKYFSYPKPVDYILFLENIISDNKSIILDFFSGSATTAHATFKINNEDNGKRKFIMVQIPEGIDEESEAYKAGFKNICEIGKERIRRAGDKIVDESRNKELDIGFKVFKLDSSNLKKWDPDYNNLEQTLLTSQDNIKSDRTLEDLIYEIMLKYGIDLTLPIEKHETQKSTIYSIGFGTLIICLDNNITKEIASEILKLTEDAEISRVVFKDNGFASDSDKTNIKEILKTNNIDEFITI